MNMVVVAVIMFLALVATPLPVQGFSSGAPAAACTTLTQQHNPNTAQTSAVPYTINLSVFDDGNGMFSYSPGMTYQREENNSLFKMLLHPPCMTLWYVQINGLCFTVSLSGGSGTPFKGFLIQARLMSDDTTVVGSFSSPPVGTRLSSCTTSQVLHHRA